MEQALPVLRQERRGGGGGPLRAGLRLQRAKGSQGAAGAAQLAQGEAVGISGKRNSARTAGAWTQWGHFGGGEVCSSE